MKKALALVMALAMVMSMAAVSMAATTLDPGHASDGVDDDPAIIESIYVIRKNASTGNDERVALTTASDDTVRFGETVYVALASAAGSGAYVTDADAVKGLNVSAKWTKNGSYIKSVELVKAKVGDAAASEKVYAIAIETTGSSTKDVTVEGEISVKGKTYWTEVDASTGDETKKSATIKETFEINLDLAYEGWGYTSGDEFVLDVDSEVLADFEDVVDADDAEEFTVKYGDITVEANVKNMKKVVLAYNEDENEELLDAYVDADLTFFNCTGNFRRTATVTIELEDGSYLYEVVDGKLVAVDGEYDDWTEEFTFKTRTMGDYVISDVKLATETVAVTNPTTGAAA